MKLFGKLVLCGTAVAVAALSGCESAPPVELSAPAPAAVPAAIPAKTVSVKLPTEALPVSVLAVSGKNILVKGDATYRLSHDSGKTWVRAAFPCLNPDGCSPDTSWRFGRVVGGVLGNYSADVNRIDAYSLVTNAVVGSSYTVPADLTVVDLAGGLVLLTNSSTGTFVLHSLLDGTDRPMAVPAGSVNHRVLDDGSVLAGETGAGTTWVRIAPDGSTSTVFSSASGTGDVLVSGNLASFRLSAGAKKPGTYCVVNVLTAAKSCHAGAARSDFQYALGSTGLLVNRYSARTQQLYWLAYSGGKLGKPKRVATVKAWDFDDQYGVENAKPLVATWTDATTSLLRPKGDGVTRIRLGWATRPVYPADLALGASTIVGAVDTQSTSLTWTRSLGSTKIGSQKRLGVTGRVAASGSRIALAERDSGRIRFFNAGRLVGKANQPEASAGYTFSGGYLLSRPACRLAPPTEDDDCDSAAALYTATGAPRKTPTVTEDISGQFRVVRGGDGSIKSRTLVVSNFVRSGQPSFTVDLPDAGTDGYYTDVRLWGDWIGATQHLSGGTVHPVVANVRTGAVLVGPDSARLLDLGAGIAVSALPHSTTLQVWQFTTGATQTVAAASTVVAVDGTRVAYLKGGKVVVATFAG